MLELTICGEPSQTPESHVFPESRVAHPQNQYLQVLLEQKIWGSLPKIGCLFGVPIIRSMVYMGLYWGTAIFAKLP